MSTEPTAEITIQEETADAEKPGLRQPPAIDDDLLGNVACIFIGSVVGVYLRHVLQDPSEYDSYSYLFPNFFGSALAGFMKKYGASRLRFSPSATGVGIGLCGSLTTFSSWMKAVALLTGPVPVMTTWHRVYLAAQICMTGTAVGVAGYDLGAMLGCQLDAAHPLEPATPLLTHTVQFSIASIVCCLCLSAALVALAIWKETVLLVALCTGPLGALFRWRLGLALNKVNPQFPIGTFSANMLACAVLAALYVLEFGEEASGTTACVFIRGFGNGFCGSLSTVSTFVTELRNIESPLRGAAYCVISVLTAQAVMALIITIYDASSSGPALTACVFH